eukprot:15366817-Ditylum_brightwellii.AAC.1
MPAVRKLTCARFVVDIHQQKEKKCWTRINIGGNLMDYLGEVHTPTTNMERYEYMKTPMEPIPNKIMQQYQLEDEISSGFVYMEIWK